MHRLLAAAAVALALWPQLALASPRPDDDSTTLVSERTKAVSGFAVGSLAGLLLAGRLQDKKKQKKL